MNVMKESVNGSETLPKELKELSAVAIKRQLELNELWERTHLTGTHFFRAFNGSVMDPEMIVERAAQMKLMCERMAIELGEIVKPKTLD